MGNLRLQSAPEEEQESSPCSPSPSSALSQAQHCLLSPFPSPEASLGPRRVTSQGSLSALLRVRQPYTPTSRALHWAHRAVNANSGVPRGPAPGGPHSAPKWRLPGLCRHHSLAPRLRQPFPLFCSRSICPADCWPRQLCQSYVSATPTPARAPSSCTAHARWFPPASPVLPAPSSSCSRRLLGTQAGKRRSQPSKREQLWLRELQRS